jgi:hypothetical protein
MDQADVRTVIHACVPESIDRFYQEVGRGGRDGHASVSLVVHTPGDFSAARRLNRTTTISIGRGRERWLRMFSDSRTAALGDGRVRVPIDVVPSLRSVDIDMVNDYNVAWNVRTLTLMSRAGLIALDCESASDRTRSATTPLGADRRAIAEEFPARVIRILDTHHKDANTWQRKVDPIRQQTSARDRRAYDLIGEILTRETRCVSLAFEAAYEVRASTVDSVGLGAIRVARSCGGCAWCRAHSVVPFAGVMPVPATPWAPQPDVLPPLARHIRGASVAVFCPPTHSDDVERIVMWLVQQGCRNVVSPDADVPLWIERLSVRPSTKAGAFVIALSDYTTLTAPKFPTVLLLNEQQDVPEALLPLSNNKVGAGETSHGRDGLVPRLYLLRSDARMRSRPDRLLRETLSLSRFGLDEFASLIGI